MLGIFFVDYIDLPLAADDLIVRTALFYWSSNLHDEKVYGEWLYANWEV